MLITGMNAFTMNLGNRYYMIGNQGFGGKIVVYNVDSDVCMEPYSIWNDRRKQSDVIHINDPDTKQDLLYFLGLDGKEDILCYDLSANKIERCLEFKLPLKLKNFGCVTTFNQRYVIIFGGECEEPITDQHGVSRRLSDRIYVLDLKLKQFQECTLKCPEVGAFVAVLMSFSEDDNALDLIIGFVRKYLKNQGFEQRIPMDIVGLISKFCQNEYIYLIEKQQIFPKHWKICVDDILNSMNTVC